MPPRATLFPGANLFFTYAVDVNVKRWAFLVSVFMSHYAPSDHVSSDPSTPIASTIRFLPLGIKPHTGMLGF